MLSRNHCVHEPRKQHPKTPLIWFKYSKWTLFIAIYVQLYIFVYRSDSINLCYFNIYSYLHLYIQIYIHTYFIETVHFILIREIILVFAMTCILMHKY